MSREPGERDLGRRVKRVFRCPDGRTGGGFHTVRNSGTAYLNSAGRDGGRQFGARTFYDARENTENGVLGDQTDATVEKGKQLFKAATEQLCHLCDWLASQEFDHLMPRDHV